MTHRLVFLTLLASCSAGGDLIVDPPEPEPATGGIRILATTTGPAAPPAGGYVLFLDNSVGSTVEHNGQVVFDDLEPGEHAVKIADIPTGCFVAGDNPRTVTVTAGDTIEVAFASSCPTPPPNHAPIPVEPFDGPWTRAGEPYEGRVYAEDPDGDPVTYRIVTPPRHGTIQLRSDGHYTYTPAPGYFTTAGVGTERFEWRASDGVAHSETVPVGIYVNAAPIAKPDTFHVEQGQVLIVPRPGLLANDFDPNSSTALASDFSTQPAHGTLTLERTGDFTYTPEPGFVGIDTFSYVASEDYENMSDSSELTEVVIFVDPAE